MVNRRWFGPRIDARGQRSCESDGRNQENNELRNCQHEFLPRMEAVDTAQAAKRLPKKRA
jgi:hypothetical protein